ncbi:MAG: riboflavin biosynthesis protein RibF [Clostridia bacterium]|nr:riboflavin biosynthesis protein RibF [Clostridia bacterium]
MLKTVVLSEKFNREKPCVLLLGGFDGMHKGHLRLMERAKNEGLPVVILTIGGGKDGKNLFTFSEREEIFSSLGADCVFELPFSEICHLSPQEFISLLRSEFIPALFICGEDFRFGNGASGTPETLKELACSRVEVEKLLSIDGEKVSTSSVKSCIAAGDVEGANVLLSERYFLKGEVVKDRGVGRTLAFPTANIPWHKDKFPLKEGVYETSVFVDGKTYRAITTYGARPTFLNEVKTTETYIDGFSGELYGKTLKVVFVRRLRDVKKFGSIDELKAQLNEDIRRVRTHD